MPKKHPSDEEPEDVQTEPVEPHEQESIKEKFSKHVNKDQLLSYAKENTLDTIAYVLLFIGLIFVFFHSFLGGLIVGIVSGFYFSNEIIEKFKKLKFALDDYGVVKTVVFAVALLTLIILAPMFFVGAGIVAGLKYLFLSEKF